MYKELREIHMQWQIMAKFGKIDVAPKIQADADEK